MAYTPDKSLIRRTKGFDGKYEPAKQAKQWLLENHSAYEQKYGLPKGALVALAGHESHFDPYARSFSGAQGLFQFTRNTAKGYGLNIDPENDERFNLEKVTDAAARYIADNLKKYNGDLVASIAQWNGGWKAADAVKEGKVSQYRSPNGKYELSGFLNGVKERAKEFDFHDVYNSIASVYGEPLIDKPKPVPEPVTRPLFVDEFRRRKAILEKKNPIPIGIRNIPKEDWRRPIEELDPSNSEFLANIDQQYRIYKTGGSLLQMSGDGKTVEAILKGNERIYSRGDVKRLMELAKKAKTPDQYFLLGKFLYDATKKQDRMPPEFTED